MVVSSIHSLRDCRNGRKVIFATRSHESCCAVRHATVSCDIAFFISFYDFIRSWLVTKHLPEAHFNTWYGVVTVSVCKGCLELEERSDIYI